MAQRDSLFPAEEKKISESFCVPEEVIHILDFVIEAVKGAGDFALSRMGNYGEIKYESPKDMLTEIDEEAEKLIISTLKKNFPDASFYGEESGRQGTSRYLFVIDPIDATTNYIKGILFLIYLFQFTREMSLFLALSKTRRAVYRPEG